MSSRRPVVEGLFVETPSGPRLVGSRCQGCGHFYFPSAGDCRNPDCADRRLEPAELGPKGTLWSYTVQCYPPPPPFRMDDFKPFAIGLVELPEGLKVLGIMTEADSERLRIGADVELVLDPLYRDENGDEVVTWKFKQLEVGR